MPSEYFCIFFKKGVLLNTKIKIKSKNSKIPDDNKDFNKIKTKASKNNISGYKTTIFSKSGLKEKVPCENKILCIASNKKLNSRFNFDISGTTDAILYPTISKLFKTISYPKLDGSDYEFIWVSVI